MRSHRNHAAAAIVRVSLGIGMKKR